MIGNLILVDWLDSVGRSGWAAPEAHLAELTPESLAHQSVGWVLRDDKDGLLIAASRSPTNVADSTFIPRAVVVNVSVLEYDAKVVEGGPAIDRPDTGKVQSW